MSSFQKAPRSSVKIKPNNENLGLLKQVLRSYAAACLVALLLIPMLVCLSSSVTETPMTQTFLNAITKVDSKIPLPSGEYQLSEDISSNASISINGEVHIDLAGKRFSATMSIFPLFEINVGGSLTISDSTTGGSVSNSGLCVYIVSGDFTLESGAMSSILTSSNCVYISSGASCTIKGGSISSSSANTAAISNNGSFYNVGGSVLSGSSVENAVTGEGTVYNTIPSSGAIEIEINTEYPDVVYSINFPVINAMTMQRSESENVEETDFSLVVNKAENLFDEREIVLEFDSDFLFSSSSGSNSFPFKLQIEDLSSSDLIDDIGIIVSNSGENITYDGKIAVDTKDIPAKGTYTAQITYSVVVREK